MQCTCAPDLRTIQGQHDLQLRNHMYHALCPMSLTEHPINLTQFRSTYQPCQHPPAHRLSRLECNEDCVIVFLILESSSCIQKLTKCTTLNTSVFQIQIRQNLQQGVLKWVKRDPSCCERKLPDP